jgi:hypothetical protein
MTVSTVDLGTLDGQRIRVKARDGDAAEFEWEGTVIAASPVAILVKPRGAMLAELIQAESILELEILANPNAKLILRRLRILKPHEVRQHLIDRHGESWDTVERMNDIAAFEFHNGLNHSNLGHIHEDKKQTARAKSIAEQAIEEIENENEVQD